MCSSGSVTIIPTFLQFSYGSVFRYLLYSYSNIIRQPTCIYNNRSFRINALLHTSYAYGLPCMHNCILQGRNTAYRAEHRGSWSFKSINVFKMTFFFFFNAYLNFYIIAFGSPIILAKSIWRSRCSVVPSRYGKNGIFFFFMKLF